LVVNCCTTSCTTCCRIVGVCPWVMLYNILSVRSSSGVWHLYGYADVFEKGVIFWPTPYSQDVSSDANVWSVALLTAGTTHIDLYVRAGLTTSHATRTSRASASDRLLLIRRAALNWILRRRRRPWDDVSTSFSRRLLVLSPSERHWPKQVPR